MGYSLHCQNFHNSAKLLHWNQISNYSRSSNEHVIKCIKYLHADFKVMNVVHVQKVRKLGHVIASRKQRKMRIYSTVQVI